MAEAPGVARRRTGGDRPASRANSIGSAKILPFSTARSPRARSTTAPVKRLITIAGVNLTVAAGIMAAIGDINRFDSPGKLASSFGLNPRVRQSGLGAAHHGRISKVGRSHARAMLVEAAWAVAKAPGPLHAFFVRIRARRGHPIAAVALPRKLTVLGWHGLTKDEDYLWGRGQPWSPTRPAPWNFQAGRPQNVDDADAPPTCPQENKSRGRGQVNSPSTAFIFRTCDKTAPNRPHPRSRHDSDLFLRLVSFLRHPGFAQALDRPVRRFEKARVAAPIGDPGLEPFPC